MKRRLMIARALMHRPKLLILDEPTAGVDIEIRRSMWDFLREINAAGGDHPDDPLPGGSRELCRHVAIIDHGRVIEHDTMASVLRKLNQEVFLLQLRDPVAVLPPLPGFAATLLNDHELEVAVPRSRDVNELFAALTAAGLHVLSLRNKSNRLEELFLRLTERKAGGSPPPPAANAAARAMHS